MICVYTKYKKITIFGYRVVSLRGGARCPFSTPRKVASMIHVHCATVRVCARGPRGPGRGSLAGVSGQCRGSSFTVHCTHTQVSPQSDTGGRGRVYSITVHMCKTQSQRGVYFRRYQYKRKHERNS